MKLAREAPSLILPRTLALRPDAESAAPARQPQRQRPSARAAAGRLPEHPRRAGIVLRRGMKQAEFRRVESQLAARGVNLLAILAQPPRRSPTTDASICGLVVTGGDMSPTATEIETIGGSVRRNLERRVPILALSDAVDLVLDAAGYATPDEAHRGVLIHRGVQVLETGSEIDDAVARMAETPPDA